MKNQLNLLLLALSMLGIVTSTQAQNKWAAGFRTGIGQVNWNLDEHDFNSNNLIWNNHVFMSRTIGKRFELELTAGYSRYHHVYDKMYADGYGSHNDILEQSITASFAGRYYFLKRSPVNAYAQLGFTAQKNFTKYDNIYYDYPTVQPYSGSEASSISIVNTVFAGAGLNYDICSSLFLTANLNVYYKADGGVSFIGTNFSNLNDWSTGLFIGGGFRF